MWRACPAHCENSTNRYAISFNLKKTTKQNLCYLFINDLLYCHYAPNNIQIYDVLIYSTVHVGNIYKPAICKYLSRYSTLSVWGPLTALCSLAGKWLVINLWYSIKHPFKVNVTNFPLKI